MTRTLAIMFVLLALGLAPAPAMDRTEAGRLFNEANDLFHAANQAAAQEPDTARDLYGKAATRFETLVREGGIYNGELYYNIGNTWFRLGDLGRAILNYRRALLYRPHDLNLQQNLAYARSLLPDRFTPETPAGNLRAILLFWHYDFSTQTRTGVFVVAFLLVWLLAGVRLFKPALAPRWLVGGCLLLALLFAASLLYETMASRRQPAGVIVAREVVARKGDGETYAPSFKEPLHAGVEFALIETRSAWLQIRLPDERTCWLPASAAELVRRD